MKTLFPAVAFAAIAILAPARAAINPAIVSADARWVVYADLNTLRSTAVGRELVAMADQAQLENAKIGLNAQKVLATIGTMTAYGTNFSPKPEAMDGTLVLQGTPDLRKISESILLQATIAYPDSVSETKDLPFPAYAVRAKQPNNAPPMAVVIAFPPEPIVLVSKSPAQLLNAYNVFRGRARSIAAAPDAPLKPLLRGAAGAYLFAASVVPADTAFPENQPQARILKMTNSGSLAIGEEGPNTVAHARLIATSEDMADKLQKILQGMTAMLSLAQSSDKDVAAFLNSAKVTRDDRNVALTMEYSSERLAQMLRMLQQHPRESHEAVAERRRERLLNGEAIAEWQAEPAATAGAEGPAPLAWRTIENVQLRNGARISLGHTSRGGKPVHFDRVEITPVNGGAPLVFNRELMQPVHGRAGMATFLFPGVDGRYTLRVAYTNDAAGKTEYAVSVRQPKPPTPPTPPVPPVPADSQPQGGSGAATN